MKYFSSLPTVNITDKLGNVKSFKNIMARLAIIPEILTDPLVYYTYDIQEGDTPEIVADKYYGDSYRYWIVMFSNQYLDPQWDWPLNNSVLNQYLLDKYTESHLYDVHHYEKNILKIDNSTNTKTKETIVIDENTYDNLTETTTTYTLPSGSTVTVSISKNIVDNYHYEFDLNESKRTINLLNSNYVNQIEREFFKLMGN